jgi:hypothetical protein
MNRAKEKNSSFELMRIFSMLMVCAYHWQLHGNNDGIISSELTGNQIISFIFGSWGTLGVNLFFLLSFYFLINKSQCNYIRILGLVVKVSFYGTAVLLICSFLGLTNISVVELIKSVLGVFAYQYWFITVYIIMSVLSPYINRLLEGLLSREIALLWSVMFYVTYILSWIIGNEIVGRLSCGFTLYITIYILVKKAPRLEGFITKYRFLGFMLVLLSILFECFLSFIGRNTTIASKLINKFQSTASPFMFILAIFIFYIFKTWQLRTNKVINFIGAYSSGAYLLHGGADFIKNVLWDGIFKVADYYNGPIGSYAIHYCLCIMALFVAGLLSEFVYTHSVGLLVDKILNKLLKRDINLKL